MTALACAAPPALSRLRGPGGRGVPAGSCRAGGSERHRAANHAAVQDWPISADLVIGHGTVKEAAIVPHHQIADAPAVGIYELRLCGVLQQGVEERPSFRFGHPEYVRGVIAEIERLSPGLRMGTNKRMIDRRAVEQF